MRSNERVHEVCVHVCGWRGGGGILKPVASVRLVGGTGSAELGGQPWSQCRQPPTPTAPQEGGGVTSRRVDALQSVAVRSREKPDAEA